MIESEKQKLGLEALNDPRWRWLVGMADLDGRRLVRQGAVETSWVGPAGRVGTPDPTDESTIRGLLVLVREALGDPRIHLVPNVRGVRWTVRHGNGCDLDNLPFAKGASEFEALLRALQGVPS